MNDVIKSCSHLVCFLSVYYFYNVLFCSGVAGICPADVSRYPDVPSLAGHNPLFTTTLTLILLSAVIIFLVAGCNKKGLDGMDLYHKIIDPKTIEQAHRSGLEILCWTVDDPVKPRQLIDLGGHRHYNQPAGLAEIKGHPGGIH